MGCMASWEDGPEYAPTQRPAAFESPHAAPLQVAPKEPSLADGAPPQRPTDFAQPTTPAPDLASLVPSNDVTRDATKPFEVASMTLTQEASAWGAAHSSTLDPQAPASTGFDPSRPITTSSQRVPGVASFAPPTSAPVSIAPGQSAPGTSAPGAYYPPPAPSGPVGIRAIWDGLTPGVAISLLIGGVIPPLSFVTYFVAFGFSFRVMPGARGVRTTFTVGLIVIGFGAILSILGAPGFAEWWSRVGWWSLWTSWATLIVAGIMVYRGLTGGNAPSPF